jgi:hypothetical protein
MVRGILRMGDYPSIVNNDIVMVDLLGTKNDAFL